MKKIITLLLALILAVSLCACGSCSSKSKLIKTESEVVDAIVTSAYRNIRWGYCYIDVAYGPTETSWYDESKNLYDYYKTHLGETIKCYLITQTFENGEIEYELVFNEDLYYGICEGEPIHPENYTFPEGVDE